MYLVAERGAPFDHRKYGVTTVAVERVHVQVAADGRGIQQQRQPAGGGLIDFVTAFAKLRGNERQAEALVDLRFGCERRRREPATGELVHVRGRSSRREECAAERVRRGDVNLHRGQLIDGGQVARRTRDDLLEVEVCFDGVQRRRGIVRAADEHERAKKRLAAPEVT